MIFYYIALSHGQIEQITLVEKITIISMKFLPNKCQSVKELLAKITVEKLTMFINTCNSVRRYPNYVHITVSAEIVQSSELHLTINAQLYMQNPFVKRCIVEEWTGSVSG